MTRLLAILLGLLSLSASAQLTLRNAAYAPLLRAPAAGGAWSPSDEGTVLMDLDASLVTIPTGTTTNYWPDSSGNGYGASQSVSGYRPVFLDASQGTNGRACFLFDGIDDYINLSNVFSGVTAATAFLVVCHMDGTEGTGEQTPWKLGSSADVEWWPHDSGIYSDAGSNTRRTDGGTYKAYVQNKKAYVITATTSSSQWNLYVNNTNVITQGSQTVGWSSSPTISGVGGSYRWKGVIFRLLIYSEALNDTKRGNVAAQFRTKYGTP